MTKKITEHDAGWALIAQFLGLFFITPMIWFFCGKESASSLAIGGGICFLPNLFFYRRVFKYSGASQATKIVRSLYIGEGFKFFFTIFLFALVLGYMPWVLASSVFGGYIAAQILFWVGPISWGIMNKST